MRTWREDEEEEHREGARAAGVQLSLVHIYFWEPLGQPSGGGSMPEAPTESSSVEAAIAELEASQQQLQEQSAATIAANLEQLTALQRQLEEDRARLLKQQRRARGTTVASPSPSSCPGRSCI